MVPVVLNSMVLTPLPGSTCQRQSWGELCHPLNSMTPSCCVMTFISLVQDELPWTMAHKLARASQVHGRTASISRRGPTPTTCTPSRSPSVLLILHTVLRFTCFFGSRFYPPKPLTDVHGGAWCVRVVVRSHRCRERRALRPDGIVRHGLVI